jgi:hypothetical protein
MPPFDYHPEKTTPAPKLRDRAPISALQKEYLRDVDTGPDSARGARFKDLGPGAAAPLPDSTPRAIFTERLARREREVLMPYLHSEKVNKSAKLDAASAAALAGSTVREGATSNSSSSRGGVLDMLRYNLNGGDKPVGASDGTRAQLDAGGKDDVAAVAGIEVHDAPGRGAAEERKAIKDDDDETPDMGSGYVRTAIPGLVFDRNFATTLGNARLFWILAPAAVYALLLFLVGLGVWGSAALVDAALLFLMTVYAVYLGLQQPSVESAASALLETVRRKYRTNPTLWQSAVLFLLLLWPVAYLLDVRDSIAVNLARAAAWTVAVTQVLDLVARYWVGVDVFAQLPAEWYSAAQTQRKRRRREDAAEKEDRADAESEIERQKRVAAEAAAKNLLMPRSGGGVVLGGSANEGESKSSGGSGGSGGSGDPPSKGKSGEGAFHVSDGRYTFAEAESVCTARGAKLATLQQIEDAYKNGAEWCGYGWSTDMMGLWPTQKASWDERQKLGTATERNACGKPGVNGGFMGSPFLKLGVNCYGPLPPNK